MEFRDLLDFFWHLLMSLLLIIDIKIISRNALSLLNFVDMGRDLNILCPRMVEFGLNLLMGQLRASATFFLHPEIFDLKKFIASEISIFEEFPMLKICGRGLKF
jgi:hypothetical protein